MTFLAIDIGNTRLKWALYAAPHPGAKLLHQGAVFLETIDELAEQQWRAMPAPASMLGCAVAGDAVRRRVEEQLELWDITPRWVVPAAREAGQDQAAQKMPVGVQRVHRHGCAHHHHQCRPRRARRQHP